MFFATKFVQKNFYDIFMNKEESINQKYVIFIGGLNFKTDEESIKRFFSSKLVNLNIEDIKICRRIEGTSKGFGYINFYDKSLYSKSLSLNGSLLDGKILRIEEQQIKKPILTVKNGKTKSNGKSLSRSSSSKFKRKSKSRISSESSDSSTYSTYSYSYSNSSAASYSSYSSDDEVHHKRSKKKHHKSRKRKQKNYSDYSYSS